MRRQQNRLRRIWCAALAMLLSVLLCACGGNAQESSEPENAKAESKSTGEENRPSNTNAALAKENVYRLSEIKIPELADSGSISVAGMARHDDRIYAAMRIADWENGDKYYALTMDESGAVLQTAFLELPAGEADANEGGAVNEGEDSKEGGVAPERDPDEWEQEDIRYSDFAIGTDGRIYALRQYNYSYINYRTEQARDEQHEYVCCWDADGRLLWQLEPCRDYAEDLSVWAVFPAADGSLELLLTGENAYRLSVHRDGALAESAPIKISEATAKALETCRRLIRREDGSCMLLCRDAEGGLSLMKYDLQTDALGERLGLPDALSATALSSVAFASGADSDLIYADRNGVFDYDLGDTQGSLKMNYVNSDRNITDVNALLELDETHFVMFYKEDYDIQKLQAGIFEYVEPEDIPDRQVVILAGLTVNGGIKQRAIRYNRENDKYRVVLKTYESCEDLNLDIISGHMPDILMAEEDAGGNTLPMESYIAKGLIADVGMLIEEDEELSRTEFLENVFDAYSVDGKWMYVIPSFTFSTMAAKSSLVGDGDGRTMEKMLETLDGMGSNARLLDGLSRSAFMEKVMKYCGNDFIDREAGTCAFDSPEFIKLMEYAYTLPEERSYAGQSGEGEYELQYLKGRTLLMELYIATFAQNVDERLCYRLNGYLGGDYTLVGFPAVFVEPKGSGESGDGALIYAQNRMALSAGSENRDGAWDFARYYLTDEYQKSLESSLPVNRQIFEEWAEEETWRSYYMDENGEKVEYDLILPWNGQDVVPPLSREQLDQLIVYVESATAAPFENAAVINIINEELESYFSGQKTAEDVAAIIQSRVQLYVRENF